MAYQKTNFRPLPNHCKEERVVGAAQLSMRLWLMVPLLLIGLIGSLPQHASAHEIRPAVADLTISATAPATVTVSIDFTAETFLAGLDASQIKDTDQSPQSADYDALRALSADALAARFTAAFADFTTGLVGRADDAPLTFSLSAFSVTDNPALALPRSSRLTISAPLPATTKTIQFGWDAKLGPLVLRQQADGVAVENLYTGYLVPGQLSAPIAVTGLTPQTGFDVFVDYIKIGFVHIMPLGFDHIIFVLGLFFFAARLKPLLIQVTLFTVAHTVTLALASTGLVTVSPAIIEPLIAASIVYVAVENLWRHQLRAGRLLIIFGFGLLHGLGFASVLGEIGLAPSHFILSLVSFNIGVELGQLAVLVPAYIVFVMIAGGGVCYRRLIATPASLAIAATGLWMLASRLVGV